MNQTKPKNSTDKKVLQNAKKTLETISPDREVLREPGLISFKEALKKLSKGKEAFQLTGKNRSRSDYFYDAEVNSAYSFIKGLINVYDKIVVKFEIKEVQKSSNRVTLYSNLDNYIDNIRLAKFVYDYGIYNVELVDAYFLEEEAVIPPFEGKLEDYNGNIEEFELAKYNALWGSVKPRRYVDIDGNFEKLPEGPFLKDDFVF